MKTSGRSIYFIFGILVLCLILLLLNKSDTLSIKVFTPSEEEGHRVQLNAAPPLGEQIKAEALPYLNGSKTENRFYNWVQELKSPVEFINPPTTDNEGLFCVINPEFKLFGKHTMEVVEDGYWYHHALKGGRGAILFGKGNGRPPWDYKIAEMYIENNELKLRHRISFGGNKGVRTRLLLDYAEKSTVSKIGVAMDEMVRGSPWGYPSVVADNLVISSDVIEKLPLVTKKPNWIELDTEFQVTETFIEPVRVVWLQFQDGGREIVRIDN